MVEKIEMSQKCLFTFLVLTSLNSFATTTKRPLKSYGDVVVGDNSSDVNTRNSNFIGGPASLLFQMRNLKIDEEKNNVENLQDLNRKKKFRILEIQSNIFNNLFVSQNTTNIALNEAMTDAIQKKTDACLQRGEKRRKKDKRGHKEREVQTCLIVLPFCSNISLNGTTESAIYFEIQSPFSKLPQSDAHRVVSFNLNLKVGHEIPNLRKKSPSNFFLKIFGASRKSGELHELKTMRFPNIRNHWFTVHLGKEIRGWRNQKSHDKRLPKIKPQVLIVSVLDKQRNPIDPRRILQEYSCNGRKAMLSSNQTFEIPHLEVALEAVMKEMTIIGAHVVQKTEPRD